MSQRAAVLRRVLSSRPLRRIVLAFLGFSCAEHGTWISVTVYAYAQGGTTEAALIAVVQLLPAAAVAPVAAQLADRRGAALALWVGYLAQAVTMTATAALLLLGAPAVAVYAAAITAACAVTFTRPAQAALLPALVESPAELTAANAVTGWLESVSYFVGPALAGLLIGLSGSGAAFAVFAAAVVASAGLVTPVALRRPGAGMTGPEDDTAGGGVLAALRSQPAAVALLGVMAVQFIGIGALDVLVVVLAIELIDIGASGAGYLNAAFGAGGIVGGAGALWLVGRHRLVPPLLLAAVAWGAAFMLIGAAPSVAGAFALFVAAGAAWTVLDVAGRTLMQRAMAPEVRGRVFGLVEGMSQAALACGSLLVPLLVVLGGPRLAIAGTGALLVVVGGGVIGLLRSLDRAMEPAEAQLAALRASSLFGALSAPVLEDLARALVPVTADAGEAVVHEGERGERYYLVGDGRLAVSQDGRHVADIGPGDGFGEIALLRDGIRRWTVTARTPVVLYALERTPFLEAVTGHPHVHRTAEGLASERLLASGAP